MTNVHRMKIFTWYNFSCLGGCNPNYIRIVYCSTDGFFGGSAMDSVTFTRQSKEWWGVMGQGVGRFASVCRMGQEKASLILSSLMVLVEIVPNQQSLL
jgi:hypothetical protein